MPAWKWGNCMPVLLVLGYVWPEPKSSAAGWRMLSLLRMYREQGWRIVFACAAELSIHRFDLTDWDIEEWSIAVNDSELAAQFAALAPDAVLFDRFMMEEQFGWKIDEACPNAIKILDSEDLHFWREARHKAYKAGRALTDADLHTELAIREVAAIYRCDVTLTISSAEMALLQQHFSISPSLLCYCPLLLDTTACNKLLFEQRQDLCFIGNFRHEPNWQTVLKLKQLWPDIHRQLPGVSLQIWGAYPPPKATALQNVAQRFYVRGWADDAHQVLSQARLLVAPIPFGAGQKGKILDAALVGTPVITSPVGAEGFADLAEFPGVIAQSDEAFIAAVVQLYRDEVCWQNASDRSKGLVAQFDYAVQYPQIFAQLEATRQQLTEHRAQNFIGAMLKHHLHRSTKFMGQWIEAKNKVKALEEHTHASA